MPQDTVPQFQSSKAFRKRHKHDINPQGTRISKTKRQGNRQPLETPKKD